MKLLLFAGMLVGLLPALLSCTTVEPWDRGRLAHDVMAWDTDPLKASLDNHIYHSKEGSSGGGAAAGGGCGCN
jgi:hypothetical protein